MPEVCVIRRSTVVSARRRRVTSPASGKYGSTGLSGESRPSSMRQSSMVVQMILLTEARSNHVSGDTSPTARWYRVFSRSNTWQTAEG